MSQTRGSSHIQVATFYLGDQKFGVNILNVKEIIRPAKITKVPRTYAYIEGVLNLRGNIIPIVSMRSLFGMPPKEMDDFTRILNMEDGGMTVGFIIDSVGTAFYVDEDAIEPPPLITSSVETEYVSGVCTVDDSMIILLDVHKLMSKHQADKFDD